MNLVDEIVHTTIRIETTGPAGRGSGTGFFVSFSGMDANHLLTMVVTNKHVIKDASEGLLHFSTKATEEADEPLLGKHVPMRMENFQNNWVQHPDPSIDLAALPVIPILNFVSEKLGVIPFYKALLVEHIATAEYMSDLLALEPITMIGYPNGLWDSANNLPIARRGMTATPPYADFENSPQFMIDCACYPGSSGSPVFLLDAGYMDKRGDFHLSQHRVKLIGILSAGPQYTVQGTIRMVPVPTSSIPVTDSRHFLNLGICVKAHELLWFEKFLQERLQDEMRILSGASARISPASS